MKVIKSNVLCKEIKSDSPVTKVGGFVIPDDQKEYREAEVVSIGEEVEKDREIKVGDKVYIYPNAGKKININGEDYRIVNVSEIIIVL